MTVEISRCDEASQAGENISNDKTFQHCENS